MITKKCIVCKGKMITSSSNVFGVQSLLICENTKDQKYSGYSNDFHSHYIISEWGLRGPLTQILYPKYMISKLNRKICISDMESNKLVYDGKGCKIFKSLITIEAVENFLLLK